MSRDFAYRCPHCGEGYDGQMDEDFTGIDRPEKCGECNETFRLEVEPVPSVKTSPWKTPR